MRWKIYRTNETAFGKLFLSNHFHLNLCFLIGRKIFSGQSARRTSRATLVLSYTKEFSLLIEGVAWSVQWEDSHGKFQKTYSVRQRKSLTPKWVQWSKFPSLNFYSGLIEGKVIFCISRNTWISLSSMPLSSKQCYLFYSSIVELLLKLLMVWESSLHDLNNYFNQKAHHSAPTFLLLHQTKITYNMHCWQC